MDIQIFTQLFQSEPVYPNQEGVMVRGQRWYIRGEPELERLLRMAGCEPTGGLEHTSFKLTSRE